MVMVGIFCHALTNTRLHWCFVYRKPHTALAPALSKIVKWSAPGESPRRSLTWSCTAAPSLSTRSVYALRASCSTRCPHLTKPKPNAWCASKRTLSLWNTILYSWAGSIRRVRGLIHPTTILYRYGSAGLKWSLWTIRRRTSRCSWTRASSKKTVVADTFWSPISCWRKGMCCLV